MHLIEVSDIGIRLVGTDKLFSKVNWKRLNEKLERRALKEEALSTDPYQKLVSAGDPFHFPKFFTDRVYNRYRRGFYGKVLACRFIQEQLTCLGYKALVVSNDYHYFDNPHAHLGVTFANPVIDLLAVDVKLPVDEELTWHPERCGGVWSFFTVRQNEHYWHLMEVVDTIVGHCEMELE